MTRTGGAGRARHRPKLAARVEGRQRGIGTAALLEYADLRELRDLSPGTAEADGEDDEVQEDVVEGAANEDEHNEQLSYGRDADDEADGDDENDWRSDEALDRPGLWVEPQPAIVIDRFGARLLARPASPEYAVAKRARVLQAIGQFLMERLSREFMEGDPTTLDSALSVHSLKQLELARWLRQTLGLDNAAPVVSKALKGTVVRVWGVGRLRLSWFFRGDARREGARESLLVTAVRSVIRKELSRRPHLTTAALAAVVRRELGLAISDEGVRRHRHTMGLTARQTRGRQGQTT